MLARSVTGLAALVAAIALASACGRSPKPARAPETGTLRAVGVGAKADPTVRPARLLPLAVDDEERDYGTEPGGGERAITAGLRVIKTAEGAVLAARARLPHTPEVTTALPDRLGGGFLFVLGTTIWRADEWLGPATPIFTAISSVEELVPGLDRVYARVRGATLAIDGRTGRVLDLGPWPASPFVTSFAAADGWRAAAVTDLRGVVATFDAGATWRRLDLAIQPREVLVSGEDIAVGGIDDGGDETWFQIRADGSISRLGEAPPEAKDALVPASPPRGSMRYPVAYPARAPSAPVRKKRPSKPKREAERDDDERDEGRERAKDPGTRIFGERPLASAIADGWPLTDGTALVARDGALGRVRLSDGALVELVEHAFPLSPARCHPVSLAREASKGAFGFVCGAPHGLTAIYAYDPRRGRLHEIRRFEEPRVVVPSGNGALVVHGSCGDGVAPAAVRLTPAPAPPPPDGGADAGDAREHASGRDAGVPLTPVPSDSSVRRFCVRGRDDTWREVRVRGDVGDERIVALADGRIAVVTPPHDEAPARLTLLAKGRVTTVPLTFPKLTPDVARVLRLGVWLDGFEERRDGVLGGWIEAGGTMLGIEIQASGEAKPGELIRDAGRPFVSGRYGFGWTASRRGFETTDGGMTWKSLELPEPLVSLDEVEGRACGPVGCVAGGWLRVGWGAPEKPRVPTAPVAYRPRLSVSTPSVSLTCEPLAPKAPTLAPPRIARPVRPPPRRYGRAPVLAAGIQGLSELPPFYAHRPPALSDGERGMSFSCEQLPERYPRLGPLARVYAWGPKSGDWATQGKWQVAWLSPFAGWPEVHTSVPVAAPEAVLDFTRLASSYGYGAALYGSAVGLWQLAPGDDPSHALLMSTRRANRTEIALFALEAGRAPLEVQRVDGEPFVQLEGVVRASGRWFLATPRDGEGAPETVVWQVDGTTARELARVPRVAAKNGRPAATHLARRSDGRAIGLVVDGEPTPERTVAVRWVLPIDLETGALGEPEPLGYADLAGRTLGACTDDLVGWELDTSLPGASVRLTVPRGNGLIRSAYARVRLEREHACLERVTGMLDRAPPATAAAFTRPGAPRAISTVPSGQVSAAPLASSSRFPLRCRVTPPSR